MRPRELWDFVRLVDLLLQRIHDIVIAAALQVIFQPLQRHADDVTVVEPGSDPGLRAQPQPDAMQPVDVFRPKPRRMRSEIYVDRRAIRIGDFERKCMARLGKIFPGEADAAGQFFRRHAGGHADDQLRHLEARCSLNHCVKGIDGGNDQEFDALALLFRHGDYVREQFLLVVGEELIILRSYSPAPVESWRTVITTMSWRRIFVFSRALFRCHRRR